MEKPLSNFSSEGSTRDQAVSASQHRFLRAQMCSPYHCTLAWTPSSLKYLGHALNQHVCVYLHPCGMSSTASSIQSHHWTCQSTCSQAPKRPYLPELSLNNLCTSVEGNLGEAASCMHQGKSTEVKDADIIEAESMVPSHVQATCSGRLEWFTHRQRKPQPAFRTM